ncbi:MAG: PfaD family polyunsaturated fatty acid/polyketide biosynthesis protein [Myxococcota bacterium]|nr:PfaD family polyunsaturated fatty acid/polyketide biosynthesis protein [Myxococcota bacterium]
MAGKSIEEYLSDYGAQTLQIFQGKQLLHEGRSSGGGLESRVQENGLAPLMALLEPKQRLTITDGSTRLELLHEGASFRLNSFWADGTHLQSSLPLPMPPEEMDISDLPPTTSTHLQSPPVVVPETSVESEATARSCPFSDQYNLKRAYVAGAMAGGIASVALVKAMSSQQMLSFFGAGGLSLEHVENALQQLYTLKTPFGFNLLHNPQQPQVEEKTVELYLKYRIRLISASAYMQLTPALVRYRLHGIFRDAAGIVHTPNRVFAKISHPSVAERFLLPPAKRILEHLLKKELITEEQAELASHIRMADALTVEGDSGGHTDRRPLSVIFPTIQEMVHASNAEYHHTIYTGAAGGIGTPKAMAAAMMLGADYLVIGSVHQSTKEADTSDIVKKMLCEASIVDTAIGIAPDMFEHGAHVQVLTRGSMYAPRSNKLRELYLRYPSIEDIPSNERSKLERLLFKRTIEEIWDETQFYWQSRDTKQLIRAEKDAKHKMALIFRWYLGQSSRWARSGEVSRKRDFQIWAGPAIGAFNYWAKGGRFQEAENRRIVDVADALWADMLKILQS